MPHASRPSRAEGRRLAGRGPAERLRGEQVQPGIGRGGRRQRSSPPEPWDPHGPPGEALPKGLAEGEEPFLRLSHRLLSATVLSDLCCGTEAMGHVARLQEVHRPGHTWTARGMTAIKWCGNKEGGVTDVNKVRERIQEMLPQTGDA